jgi:hypothetical protein
MIICVISAMAQAIGIVEEMHQKTTMDTQVRLILYKRTNISVLQCTVSQGSSVSIMFECGLNNWGLIPGRGKGFFF